MESQTVSMSESSTGESSSKLSIVLEILLVPLPWTSVGVEQERCRTWHAEYEAPYS